MASIYRHVLGEAFDRLQPELRDYFSLTPESNRVGVGEGIFQEAGSVRRAFSALWRPLSPLRLFFPEHGRDVPFTIINSPHYNHRGESCLSAVRTFRFPGTERILEDTTVLRSGRLVDYVGRHRMLRTPLELSVDGQGRMRMLSPTPTATADMTQWWEDGAFHIDMTVAAPVVGPLFVYRGTFTYRTVERGTL